MKRHENFYIDDVGPIEKTMAHHAYTYSTGSGIGSLGYSIGGNITLQTGHQQQLSPQQAVYGHQQQIQQQANTGTQWQGQHPITPTWGFSGLGAYIPVLSYASKYDAIDYI